MGTRAQQSCTMLIKYTRLGIPGVVYISILYTVYTQHSCHLKFIIIVRVVGMYTGYKHNAVGNAMQVGI